MSESSFLKNLKVGQVVEVSGSSLFKGLSKDEPVFLKVTEIICTRNKLYKFEVEYFSSVVAQACATFSNDKLVWLIEE